MKKSKDSSTDSGAEPKLEEPKNLKTHLETELKQVKSYSNCA